MPLIQAELICGTKATAHLYSRTDSLVILGEWATSLASLAWLTRQHRGQTSAGQKDRKERWKYGAYHRGRLVNNASIHKHCIELLQQFSCLNPPYWESFRLPDVLALDHKVSFLQSAHSKLVTGQLRSNIHTVDHRSVTS